MKLSEAKAGGKSIRVIPKGLPIGKSKAVRGIIAACAFHSPLFLYKDHVLNFCFQICDVLSCTLKLGDKERFDKE